MRGKRNLTEWLRPHLAVVGSCAALAMTAPVAAAGFDDVSVAYDVMRVSEAFAGGKKHAIDLYRHTHHAGDGVDHQTYSWGIVVIGNDNRHLLSPHFLAVRDAGHLD